MELHVPQRHLLSAVCAKALVRWGKVCLRISPIIPYYHIVNNAEVPHVKHLYRYRGETAFKRDLDVLLKQFRAIALEELIAYIKGQTELAKNAFLLTFDDGFREMRDVVAPILLHKGVPATFFITTDYIDNQSMAHHNKLSLLLEHLYTKKNIALIKEVSLWLSQQGIADGDLKGRLLSIDYHQGHLVDTLAVICSYNFEDYLARYQPYLTSEQIYWLLKQGFTIGSHSMDHPYYAMLSIEEQLNQTRTSLQLLEERFKLPYRAFAFPHSDNGVKMDFFRTLFDEGELDVSFGTGGMLPHSFPRHLQRFTMEKSLLPAEGILARQYARTFYRTRIRRGA